MGGRQNAGIEAMFLDKIINSSSGDGGSKGYSANQ